MNLLGMRLTNHLTSVSGIIAETEAYTEDDPASHCYLGKKTNRNSPMFLNGGHCYIYKIYGLHYCFNFVTDSLNIGSSVLLRSIAIDKGQCAAKKKETIVI